MSDAPEPVAPPEAEPAAEPAAETALVAEPRDGADVELLGLIDRLTVLLDHSDLTELEVEVGGTGLVLRKPGALPGGSDACTAGAGVRLGAARWGGGTDGRGS